MVSGLGVVSEKPWTTLEIATLCVDALTPLLVVLLGIYLQYLTKKIELMQWRNQKLIEKRLSIYDELAPLLNDNLCYFTYVGNWKERSPEDVIQSKREIDKKIYLAAPMFSKSFFDSCMTFQHLCFKPFNGTGQNAKLKTDFKDRKTFCIKPWKEEWVECFSPEISAESSIQAAYNDVMKCFSDEIGIEVE